MNDETEINWLDETVGRDREGHLVMKLAGDVTFIADQQSLYESHDEARRLKWDLEEATRRINAREPSAWIPKLLADLKERADASEDILRLIEGPGSPKVPLTKNMMTGQTQAYRDAIGMIQHYLPKE